MIKRRNFLKISGAGLLPVITARFQPAAVIGSCIATEQVQAVNFMEDGPAYKPQAYVQKLQEILGTTGIKSDFYDKGGVVAELEKKITALTGKEAAIYVPTGTMANQMAIALLSGGNTKVYLQETSHIFRDEADAAQSVYGKRLVPLAKGEPFFTLEQLQTAIAYDNENEVFKSGIGAIAIENPVRRCDGRQVSFEELQKISAFCRENKYPLHLDGARLFLASACSGVGIADYARLFDTVYISLYKYMGAGGGAILAGDKILIDKMEHLIKIHGGTIYTNWPNAAMALHHLDGLQDRLQRTMVKARELVAALNQVKGIQVAALPGGTNIFLLTPGKEINGPHFSSALRDKQILIRDPNAQGIIRLQMNESLLTVDIQKLVNSFTIAASGAIHQ